MAPWSWVGCQRPWQGAGTKGGDPEGSATTSLDERSNTLDVDLFSYILSAFIPEEASRLTDTSSPQSSAHWAETARRRSFAWGVAAGKKREQLAREFKLTPAQVHQLLSDPDVAMMAWIWRAFVIVERQGFGAVMRYLRERLLWAMQGHWGVELALTPLLIVLLGLTFLPLSLIGRDLLAELTRARATGPKGSSPFSGLRLRLVHEIASILEEVSAARLWHERRADMEDYVQSFVEIAAEGGEPFLELALYELPSGNPAARHAAGAVPALGDALVGAPVGASLPGWLRFKRRRGPWWSLAPPWLAPPWVLIEAKLQ